MNQSNMMKMMSFNKVMASQSKGLLLGIATLVVFFASGVWWILQPNYVSLYKDSSEAGRTEVTSLLAQQKIPYQIGKDGAVEVLQQNLERAREKLAEAGLPAKPGTGYEIFDNTDYGMSEFSQKINYQRALEGELARSIMGLREIKYARVHLMLKKNSLYSSQQESAKASIVLQLRTGMMLDKKQIFGIQQLVASSVDSLMPEAVVIIDETGQPLNGHQNYAAFDDRWQISTSIENDLQAKAQEVLNRIYGESNAQVSVRVQMNFDRMKSVKELPVSADGNGNGIVVKEKQLQTYDEKKGAESSDAKGREQSSGEVEYAIGRNHSEIEYSPGKIERISVGIVLSSNLGVVDVKALNELMSATLGLNDERGDRLSIAHMPMLAETHTSKATFSDISPALTSKPQSYLAFSWWYVATLLFVALIIIVVVLGFQRKNEFQPKPQALLSPVEREKLLQDVHLWLARDAEKDMR